MKRQLLMATVATVGLLGALPARADLYYFNFHENSLGGAANPSLFLFGANGTSGDVTNAGGFLTSFSIGATGFFNMPIATNQQMTSTGISNLGFTINSSAPVSAFFINRKEFTTDMSFIQDGSKLGTSYVVAANNGGNGGSQLSVRATQDNTSITITPKVGAPIVQVLNSGQSYYLETSGGVDLTGSSVIADKPVAVFSGHLCGNVPSSATACDHLYEQMPSVDKLSKTYYIGETLQTGTGTSTSVNGQGGNLVRVIASEGNTTVSVNGVLVATLVNKGDFYEFNLQDGAKIDASSPVLVAQYLKGQSLSSPDETDPAMTIVVGQEQWLKDYAFSTPDGNAAFTTNSVNIVIETADLASLTIDGIAPSGTCVAIDSIFSSCNYTLTVGRHNISAGDEFQLLALGGSGFDSYFTIGGAAFAVGASPPPPPPIDPPPSDVPAPASIALLGAGLAGLTLLRRRRS